MLRADTPFNFCIIDEVDSILIDEARTPLIISGPSDKPSDKYYKVGAGGAVRGTGQKVGRVLSSLQMSPGVLIIRGFSGSFNKIFQWSGKSTW